MMKFLLFASMVTIADAIIRCKNCNGVLRMSECMQTTQCRESCYTRKFTTPTGQSLFESGCSDNKVCSALSQLGKRAVTGSLTNCYQCCSTWDNCNDDLCQQMPPAILHYPNNKTANDGEMVKLQCIVETISNPTIRWIYVPSVPDTTVNLNAVTFSNNNMTVCFKASDQTYGKWTCIATNRMGSSKASAFVKQPSTMTNTNSTPRRVPATTTTSPTITTPNPTATFRKPVTTTPKPTTTPTPTTTTQNPTTTTTPKPNAISSIPTTSMPTTTPKPSTISEDNCVDEDPRCAADINFAFKTCSDTVNFIKCRKTCRVCKVKPASSIVLTTLTATMTTLKHSTTGDMTFSGDKCVDEDPRCAHFDFVFRDCIGALRNVKCRKTCKVCNAKPALTVPQTSPTTQMPITSGAMTNSHVNCVDDDIRCATDFNYIVKTCADPVNFIKCRKTCKTCDATPYVTPAPTVACVDEDSRCAQDFNYIFTVCSSPTKYKICRKTCRVC